MFSENTDIAIQTCSCTYRSCTQDRQRPLLHVYPEGHWLHELPFIYGLLPLKLPLNGIKKGFGHVFFNIQD